MSNDLFVNYNVHVCLLTADWIRIF